MAETQVKELPDCQCDRRTDKQNTTAYTELIGT